MNTVAAAARSFTGSKPVPSVKAPYDPRHSVSQSCVGAESCGRSGAFPVDTFMLNVMFALMGIGVVTAALSVTTVLPPTGTADTTTVPAGMPGALTSIPAAICGLGAKSSVVPPTGAPEVVTRANAAVGPPPPITRNDCARRMNASMRAWMLPVPGGSHVGFVWKNLIHCARVTAASASIDGVGCRRLAMISSPSAVLNGAGTMNPSVSADRTRLRQASGSVLLAPGQNFAASSSGKYA